MHGYYFVRYGSHKHNTCNCQIKQPFNHFSYFSTKENALLSHKIFKIGDEMCFVSFPYTHAATVLFHQCLQEVLDLMNIKDSLSLSLYIYMYIYMYVCMYVYMYVCMYLYVLMTVGMLVCFVIVKQNLIIVITFFYISFCHVISVCYDK